MCISSPPLMCVLGGGRLGRLCEGSGGRHPAAERWTRRGWWRQVVQVEGWKTEHVEEFLDDKLLQPPVARGAKASA